VGIACSLHKILPVSWSELNIQGMSLPLIIHIKKTGNEFSSTMDSKQGATNIPLALLHFMDNQLA
jgi:hypothetical protein